MTSVLYAAGRVSVAQKNMLSSDKLNRIVAADGLEEAVRILSEYNYGGGIALSSPFAYEEMLCAEERSLYAFLREILPEGSGFETFFYEADFHNAKVLAKERFCAAERVTEAVNEYGMIPFADLARKLSTSEYDGLPTEMTAAFRDFEKSNEAGTLLSSDIDAGLDRAFYEFVFALLKKCRDKRLTEYYRDRVDGINIGVFLRCRRIGLDVSALKGRLIRGGNIATETLVKYYDKELTELRSALVGSVWYKLITEYIEDKSMGAVGMETATEDVLTTRLAAIRYEMETVGSIAFYYREKTTEIKDLRIVLTGKKNKVDNKAILSRLRKLYA